MSFALWCVLAAAFLPYFAVGIAKIGSEDDNHDPRGFAAKLQGYRRRAYAAHQNALEAFPFFAAAVIVAEMLGKGSTLVNILALVWIAARLAHLACYLADWAAPRSIMWTIAFLASVAIFIQPAIS